MPLRRVSRGRINTIKTRKQENKKTRKKPTPKPSKIKVTKPVISQKLEVRSQKSGSGYTAKHITVLEGLDAVRRRPGMYIGTTGSAGLHHLIWEVVDNAIDEAMSGYCNQIEVKLLPGHWVSVTDNGRGIPVDIHPTEKKSALEVVLTKLHAGGKFGEGGYKVSGGLHGVGVSVVNALSIELKAIVRREGKIWEQEYRLGKPLKKVRSIGNAQGTGTTILFHPDPRVLETLDYEWKTVLDHLRQQAYLTKAVHITISDERTPEEKEKDKTAIQLPVSKHHFYFEGGIASYVKHINKNREPKHDNVFYVEKEMDKVVVEIALQYTEDYSEALHAFANNIINPDGGMHVAGFRAALTRTLNAYARNKGILKEKDDNLGGEDVREGLTAIISIKVPEPQFEGQTKSKLGNPEVKPIVETVFSDAFLVFLEEHPRDGEAILGKCILAAKARNAARIAREAVLRKGALEGFTLPGKLADCASREAENSELFIVEGDSAGGCFSGDTKVALTDGRNLSFIELERENKQGKQNYCYTIMPNGHIGIEKILAPRKTKNNAVVIEIAFDNSETILCTPDHKFLLRNGEYKMAKNLTLKDSLMPLRKQISRLGKHFTIEGYELVYDPFDNRWIFTHLLADDFNLREKVYKKIDGAHRHHKDFNKLNNNPPNLCRLSKAVKQWSDASLRQWRVNKTAEQWTTEFRAKRKAAYNKVYLNSSLKLLHEVLMKFNSIELYDAERRAIRRNKNYLKLATLLEKFFNNDISRLEETARNYNHRIIKIKRCKKHIPVYDIEVPNTHNFALASGVFVHNSAKQGRDRHTQAILPLRGKVLNVERARIDKLLANNELKSLIIALGTNIGEMFDIAKLRYHKIVIMTDADVDGSHIRTLLLTLFFRYFPDLIYNGYIYIAQPPLFSIKEGTNIKWIYNEEALEKYKKEYGIKEKEYGIKEEDMVVSEETEEESPKSEVRSPKSKLNIQRYKGLGEMNPEQLWETTMNPANRVLKKVMIEDGEKASEIFDILMGSEVAPRKKFIQTHAKSVKNLDI